MNHKQQKRNKIRSRELAHRKAHTDTQHRHMSQQLCTQLYTLISTYSLQGVHSFLPIASQKEPNIYPLLQRLWVRQTPIYTSVLQSKARTLQHVRLFEHTVVKKGLWGIPTPIDAPSISIQALQSMHSLLVLTPLLAFDVQGHRLGYGKGYYDQLLAKLPRCYAIGVALTVPIDTIHPIETDAPLHACATPQRTYVFQKHTL